MEAYDFLKKLRSCTDGDISIEDFEEWFDSSSWGVHETGVDVLVAAVFDIESILGRYFSGEMDAAMARRHMFAAGTSLQTALKFMAEQMASGGSMAEFKEFQMSYGYSKNVTPVLSVSTRLVVAAQSLEPLYAGPVAQREIQPILRQ